MLPMLLKHPLKSLMLLRRFSKCSTPVKCYLYNSYCSHLYCALLWYSSTVTTMKKLCNSASEICICLNLLLVYKYIDFVLIKWIAKQWH